ncbi:NUDIX domain-containing protein [Aggregatilinea lenta]|uniref:NUDIX domain-containing protein n=1 Tax=Aggregatilinea lenta TaxID=913108 RepID=UPI0013C2AFFA|nr:NUDIX domain-containing protein [Aggregatilinea lenta]
MTLIPCRTLYNETRLVPADTLIQRPSVYGLIVYEGRLLVAEASCTHKYVLPGGGIEPGEDIQAALVREVAEETGLYVEVGPFLHFETDFLYYDPLDQAFHGFMFYYQGYPRDTQLGSLEYPVEEGLDRPLWVDIHALTPDSFQSHGPLALDLLSRIAAMREP